MSTEIPGVPAPHPYAAEVQRRRKDAGLSQNRLAELADLSSAAIRRIEKGWERRVADGPVAKVNPNLTTVVKIALALQWNPREAGKLAGYQPHELRDLPTPEPEGDEPPHAMIELWPRLTKKQRKLIEDVAVEFAARNRELLALTRTDNRFS